MWFNFFPIVPVSELRAISLFSSSVKIVVEEWIADQGNYPTPVQEPLPNVMQFLMEKLPR